MQYIEKKNENKYLIFNSTDESKELLKKYSDVWSGIKNKIDAINSCECDYEKGFMKIKFISDNNLPLNKPLKFHTMTIRYVFEEDGNFYLQVFLDDALYELMYKMLEYDRIDISKGIDINRTSILKEHDICHFWYFKDIGFKYETYLCNGCHDLVQKAEF